MSDRASSRWISSLAGQAAGFGLVVGLVGLQTGADLSRLFERLDLLTWAVLLAWPASHLLVAVLDARLGAERPLVPVLVALAPLVLAFALAAMSTGNLGFIAGLENPCASFLSVHHGAERLRTLGLLACAACWFGCLPGALRRQPDLTPYRPVWRWPLGAALLLAAAGWTFLDPLLPTRSAVGSVAVRGLWVLAGAVPVAALWLASLARPASDRGAERGLALWTILWGAWLLAAAGVWVWHRGDALLRLSYPASGAPVVWPGWFEAGLVLGAAVLCLLPLAVLSLAGSVSLYRLGPGAGRRRAVGLALALAVLGLLGLAHESGFREGFAARCQGAPEAGGERTERCLGERRVFGVCLSESLPSGRGADGS